MEWNHFAIGGEVCINPDTGEKYARMNILDRISGKRRGGPISADQLDELINGLTSIRQESG